VPHLSENNLTILRGLFEAQVEVVLGSCCEQRWRRGLVARGSGLGASRGTCCFCSCTCFFFCACFFCFFCSCCSCCFFCSCCFCCFSSLLSCWNLEVSLYFCRFALLLALLSLPMLEDDFLGQRQTSVQLEVVLQEFEGLVAVLQTGACGHA
jgi:hypothetical protein